MKVLVASSEKFAGCIVDALVRHGHEVVAVISPQKGIYERQGYGPRFWPAWIRGWNILPLCRKLNIEFRVVKDIGDGALKAFMRKRPPDLLVVFGWPKVIDEATLAAFPLGGINIHPSLLPKLRGPDPLFHIVDQGADGFGVSFHGLTQELDAGPIHHQVPLMSADGASYDQLYTRILEGINAHLPKALENVEAHPEGRAQQGDPSFVARFRPRFRVLDPKEKATAIWRRTRACYSHHARITAVAEQPLTFTRFKTMPHKELVYREQGAIQRVGLFSLEVNLSGRYVCLGGVRIPNKPWWLSPLALAGRCKPGQVLASAQEARRLAREHGLY